MTSGNKSWQLRAFQAGDEAALTALFKQVFGREISAEIWRWKLKANSSLVENVWLGVTDADVIFQYAAMPTRYQLAGSERLGMVSVDTMTAPDFRRMGLLTTVGRHAYEEWRKSGAAFVIGLPNENWGSRATHLGWQPLFRLQWLNFPLRPEKLLANKLSLPILHKLAAPARLWTRLRLRKLADNDATTVHTIDHAEEEFDQLWATCRSGYAISIVRDSAWVNWRFLSSPVFDYRVLASRQDGVLTGYLVYRIAEEGGRSVGFIAEVVTAHGDLATLHCLLATAFGRFSAANVETIATLAVPGSWHFNSLRSAGFFMGKHSFSAEYVPLTDDLPADFLCNPANWLMSGADYDVI